jgi:hypothetical protein
MVRRAAISSHRPIVRPVRFQPSMKEMLKAIWSWWRGKHPSLREQIREMKLIERFAEEIDHAEADLGDAEVAAWKTGSRTLGQAVR